MSEIIIEEINSKKPQSDAVKRAKAKYYSKKKLDPEFMEQNRSKQRSTIHTIQNVIKINVRNTI